MAGVSSMIDIGANLTDPVFCGSYRGKQKHDNDYDTVLTRAKANGVDKIIITGGNLEESRKALELAKQTADDAMPMLYSTVGVHPTRCDEFKADPEKYFADLVEVCQQGMQDGKVVAVGECGLDYDRLEFCEKATQRMYFEKQFELAERMQLPLFLHNRNTDGDFYEMIAKNRHRFTNGVVHSFTGTQEEAQKLLELDLYIGVNGCSLKTEENLETVRSIPLDRLLLETDAPWCDIRPTHAGFHHVQTKWQSKKPDKYEDGKLVKGRNEPCTMTQVLEVVSGIRGEKANDIASAVYANTLKVFFPTE